MTKKAYDEVVNSPHKAKLSHELIVAAAAYQATKAYNEHREKNGEDVSHATAKQIMAAASAAFVDHIIETKGFDALDSRKAKQDAAAHHNQHLSGIY